MNDEEKVDDTMNDSRNVTQNGEKDLDGMDEWLRENRRKGANVDKEVSSTSALEEDTERWQKNCTDNLRETLFFVLLRRAGQRTFRMSDAVKAMVK